MTAARVSRPASGPAIAGLERGRLYSEELGIALAGASDAELFRWFVASILFGARISETIARKTYRKLVHYRLTEPRKILAAGREFLIDPVMREGGYVRYDGRKSEQLVRVCNYLLDNYQGKMSNIHAEAADGNDLEARLLAFFGVGPVTVNIFLRELRPYWRKANPEPLPVVVETARTLGIDLSRYDPKSLKFVRMEAGLIRRAHNLMKSGGEIE